MLNGIDFSFGGGLTTTQIHSGGKTFVARYLSGGASKDISATELGNYKAAGIPVIFVWETTGVDMTSTAAGVADAKGAQAELNRLASGTGDQSVSSAPVFFAADEATEPAEGPYLAGAASVVGKARTGVYGGVGSIGAGFDGGHVTYGWQTIAWSAGQWDNRALLRQVQNNVRFGPATVDLDEAAYWSSTKVLGLGDDFGQWPKPSAAPPPPPSGPYRHVVAAGNTKSLWRIAQDRNTSEASLISLSRAHLGPENLAFFNAYVAYEEASRPAKVPLPPMGEGLIWYSVNA